MIMFNCDYNEGCCQEIMDEMIRTNMEQHEGYSEDGISAEAKALVKKACEREDVDVHIMVGGTQTNMTVISAGLRPYQGVVAPATGHIARHETGAIEAHGHKVLALPETDGKISAEQIEK
ncbi:MAG: low specificity L-threonine aldolase, partial [Firmicutes bacterium]|nr:low specificity L-threonine aldolase [Bacillota bacterium]